MSQEKVKQLKKYKRLATGLFLLMLLVFLIVSWMAHLHFEPWMGYVKAFSEAAMVGALADWFAVTALFHYPLGIKIPHTNLIENSKQRIGDNLGNFVVGNFLTPANIKPYIKKLSLAGFAGEWLGQGKNKEIIIAEVRNMLIDILQKIEDKEVVAFMERKGKELVSEAGINHLFSGTLNYLVENGQHHELITVISRKLKAFVIENEYMIREKVSKESYFFVPKFLENKLADKITGGIYHFFDELENNNSHHIRLEVEKQLEQLADDMKGDANWEHKMRKIAEGFITNDKANHYFAGIWESLKQTMLKELHQNDSTVVNYLYKIATDISNSLNSDEKLRNKIDAWIQHTVYKFILRNAHTAGNLISNTVGNWESRELSQKLELEVGKDLQFIRINGTLVGGLVGLLIYTISHLLF